ncbi:MAG: YidC/Oxa1 family membrane protein insertase [bacterium]|nr:YidC/Oxa1 family membrane protein insertase [bacterium]
MSWLIDAILNILLAINDLVGNLGFSIIIFTLVFRGITLAFTYKSLKSMKKMQAMSEEVKALQKKYKNDPQALQLAQMELYKKYNVNPISGCLPQILQIVMLIIIYQVLLKLMGLENLTNVNFFWLNLTQPDPLYVIPVLAVLSQLFLSIMTLPGGEVRDVVPDNSKKKAIQELNEKENDTAQMAATMQKQMLFILPFMTGFIALKLPSGLGLYWVVSTIFSIGQQVLISGWGGITIYWHRLKKCFINKQD